MLRYALAGVVVAGALASASPALACTIDTCSYTQPVCNTHVVDCSDLSPFRGCVDTIAGYVCVPDPHPLVSVR